MSTRSIASDSDGALSPPASVSHKSRQSSMRFKSIMKQMTKKRQKSVEEKSDGRGPMKRWESIINKDRFKHTQIEVKEKVDTKKVQNEARKKFREDNKKKEENDFKMAQKLMAAAAGKAGMKRMDSGASVAKVTGHSRTGSERWAARKSLLSNGFSQSDLSHVREEAGIKSPDEITKQPSHPAREELSTTIVLPDKEEMAGVNLDPPGYDSAGDNGFKARTDTEDSLLGPMATLSNTMGPTISLRTLPMDTAAEVDAGSITDASNRQLSDLSDAAEIKKKDDDKDTVELKKPIIPETDKETYAYFKPKKGKKAGRRIVFFDGKLKRVSDIETAEETFSVVFHFYMTWLMSYDEVEDYFKAKATMKDFEKEWRPDWEPELECENRVEGAIEQVGGFKCKEGTSFKALPGQDPKKSFKHPWGKSSFDIKPEQIGFDPRYAFWCRIQYNCEFSCAEELELEFFPFDCQDLGIYMKCKDKADTCDILPFPRHGEIFNIDATYSMVSEWKIPGILLEFSQGDPLAAKNGVPYNNVTLRVKAERKWEAHMADSITIFCMFWLGLATFSMPVEDVGDRLAYCITLLLADIATMQLLNESTPTIPYRTFLDTYTYACFLFLVIVTVWVAIAGFGGEPNLGYVVDWWAFWVFSVVLTLMHLVFLKMIHVGRKDEKSKLQMDSEDLDAFFDSKSNLDSISAMPVAGVAWTSKSIDPDEFWTEEFCAKHKLKTYPESFAWSGRSFPWAQKIDDEYTAQDPLLGTYHPPRERSWFRRRSSYVNDGMDTRTSTFGLNFFSSNK